MKVQRPQPQPRRAADGGLFGASSKAAQAKRRKLAPELLAARVLCNQLKRKRAAGEKKRLVHLICLNLVTILKRRSLEI